MIFLQLWIGKCCCWCLSRYVIAPKLNFKSASQANVPAWNDKNFYHSCARVKDASFFYNFWVEFSFETILKKGNKIKENKGSNTK